MTGEQLAVIFDTFTQADDSITLRYGGTGLGLLISSQILDSLAPSGPSKGSEFTFDILFDYSRVRRGNP